MRHGWTVATAMVFFAMASTPASGDPAADKCGGAKMKAAGRYAGDWLICNATATRRDLPVDGSCLTRASGKLTAAFAKAESTGGCATVGDASATAGAADAAAAAGVAALAPADDDARRCAAIKTKGAAKHMRGLLACFAKRAPAGEGPDASCLARAYGKLVKVFSKAKSKGGCTTTGDLPGVNSLDNDGVEDQVRALSPVCGDGLAGPTQECETTDDATCPGLCSTSCICVYPPDCGDGVAELPEQCDDGGNDDGDGCSSVCRLEDASALCTGVPWATGTGIDAVLVSSAFLAPVHAAAPPLDPSRLFVVERAGTIRIVDLSDDSIEPVVFLDIENLVGTSGEGGLLSMAFDPDYATNRRFFVNYTNSSGDTTIARYETSGIDPNVADNSTARVLLVINQPYDNHNGGQLAFGADGYLYVGMGDGGGGGDPDETGQDDSTLLGKMLRMDVDVDAPPYWAVPPTNPGYVDGSSQLELIWAKGLRNPWRFSFDRATGDLLIADVGQGAREEIDFQDAASTGGENYGWDIFEGTLCHEPDPAPMCPAPPTGFTMPIFEYSHAVGCSISGGFVYRGCGLPDLAGQYFYSDYCSGFVRTVEISGGAAINPADRTSDAESAGASLNNIVSWGEDARGEIYAIEQGGEIYRIVAE